MSQPQILFEDEYLLAINKSSGMVVNDSALASKGDTLQAWVGENFDFPLAHNKELRNGVVHRLDKETSGVLLVAKNPEVFVELQRQFKDREVEKVYVGLVHGRVEPKEGVIDSPIARNPRVRTKFAVVENGREATTEYKNIRVLEHQDEKYTLVEFKPKTGRTHQIRVHAKHIGHPIVGDYSYAGRKTARHDRKWCPRLFLHAAKLTFIHPTSGKHITVEAPLPHDLSLVIKTLRSHL